MAIRVFVLCTGRCGSQTIALAFTAAQNFTSGHETRIRAHPNERLDYPDDHIEADNRLSWFLGELDDRFGTEALYVHLRRDPEQVAESYAARWPRHTLDHDWNIIGSYAHGVFHRRDWPFDQRLEVARAYVSTVTSNIELFLKDKPRVIEANLETLADDVERIWHEIGATGDLAEARRLATERSNVRKDALTRTARARFAARRWRRLARVARENVREGRDPWC